MKSLDIKISEASRNVKANMRLNDMLESKMIALVSKSLDKLNLYNLMDKKDDIFNKYSSLSYAKDMAKDNLDSSIELKDDDMKLECEKMLSDITKEYDVYDKEVNIIKERNGKTSNKLRWNKRYGRNARSNIPSRS